MNATDASGAYLTGAAGKAASDAAHDTHRWAHNARRLRELAEAAERGEIWTPEQHEQAQSLARSIWGSMLVAVWQERRA
jgi:hypothetical protein